MKSLLVMRHAKSSWDDPSLPDFDRPLNQRGMEAAPRIGEFLAMTGFMPDLLVSSPAVRAQITSELFADASGYDGEMWYDRRIYLASSDQLLEIVQGLPESVDCVMLVGHNPGLEDLVEDLCGGVVRMPTAAVAYVEIQAMQWQQVDIDMAVLNWLITPKLLRKGD